jgi:hypothetical protein
MRSHGVPNFPDPKPGGPSVIPNWINLQAPAFKSAQKACAHFLGGGGGSPAAGAASEKLALLSLAKYMRSHGFSNFSDPTTSPPPAPPPGSHTGNAVGIDGARWGQRKSSFSNPPLPGDRAARAPTRRPRSQAPPSSRRPPVASGSKLTRPARRRWRPRRRHRRAWGLLIRMRTREGTNARVAVGSATSSQSSARSKTRGASCRAAQAQHRNHNSGEPLFRRPVGPSTVYRAIQRAGMSRDRGLLCGWGQLPKERAVLEGACGTAPDDFAPARSLPPSGWTRRSARGAVAVLLEGGHEASHVAAGL